MLIVKHQSARHLILCFMVFHFIYIKADAQQNDTAAYYKPARARMVGTALAVAYAGSMTGLYKLWYEDYPTTHFHFFNDRNEWKRMDKMGHIGSAYYLSRWNTGLIRWTGTPHRKSAVEGTSLSYLYLSTIELFDAYSLNWGFSVSDVIANTTGCMIYLGQELAWKEQRIQVKFSYRATDFAAFRPDALGETDVERLFKDYNGQTYWLSFNIYSFIKDSRFPKWLNLAAGYGADGMVTAYEQVFEIDHVIFPQDQRLREYYISADIDLARIKWNSRFMKTVSEIIGFIKVPLPAVKWQERHRPQFLLFGF